MNISGKCLSLDKFRDPAALEKAATELRQFLPVAPLREL
jgi:hypothetical protein